MTEQEPEDWVENIRMLTESAGAVVPPDGSLERVRTARFIKPGYSADIWKTIVDMGWLGIRVSERSGGLGLGVREGVGLARTLGEGLIPEPVLQVGFALDLLEGAGLTEDIARILSGNSIIVPAWQSTPYALDVSGGVSMKDGRLHGTKIAVSGGAGADVFAVTVPEGIALIPADADGLAIEPVRMHDGTFHVRLTFDAVACEVHPCASIEDNLFEAMMIHGAYLLGVAERAFDITLDYLRTRRQFEVAIGSFQALQHRATEIKVQLELARAAIGAAAAALDHRQDRALARPAILRARARAGALVRLVSREAVQMHGAIGYTDEADIGLFVRKAMVEAGQFAPEFRLRERFMALRDAAETQDRNGGHNA